MRKYKILYSFLIALSSTLILVFCIHVLVLKQLAKPLFGNMIISAYVINAILALVIFVVLYVFRNKWKNYLGFLFLGGSMLKFLIFFIVFNPVYKNDGAVETVEFAAFFIPYFLSLSFETLFTARMLNNL
ncbi:hypothetical protein [uncultured Maribacter sp.]|uniref:hypothetical protein n=1 Tax=uncultured Maribacter sp. TaxID=431308 RepID=UPI0026257B81|nr:hypothetical protein [uncultured Maribacter sp.]